MKTLLVVAVAVVLTACGGSTSTGAGGGAGGGSGGGSGGGAGGGAGGGSGGGAGGGSAGVALTVAECQQDMERFVAQNCTDKGDWQTAKTVVCPKSTNASSALCNGPLVKAKTCHAQFQTATLMCTALGQTDSADPCAVDILLGVFCVASTNNNLCYATPCTSSLDCGTGYSCNERTGRCYNTSANCLGLPCTSSLHCPTGQTCNGAAEQCVKS